MAVCISQRHMWNACVRMSQRWWWHPHLRFRYLCVKTDYYTDRISVSEDSNEAGRTVSAIPQRYAHMSHGLPHKPHPLLSGLLASIYLCVNPLLFHIPPPTPSSLSHALSFAPSLSPLKASRLLFDPGCLLHDRREYNARYFMAFWVDLALLCWEHKGMQVPYWTSMSDLSFPFPYCDRNLFIHPSPWTPLSPTIKTPSTPCILINAATPSTMLPCINWLQPLLALISSTLLTRGHNCPSSCLCPDHHTVDCTGRGLTRVPDSIPLDVRRLLLSNNWIPWIPADFLVLYSDLVYLDLRNNSLYQLDPGTLTTSSRLVFLDLGSNNLTEIPSGTFGESRSLIKLRLGNNPYLNMVGRDAFTGLTSLRELELERNGLTELDVDILESLPSLRMLRLEGNPWFCNCHFAKLFVWLMENRHKLPRGKSLAAESIIFPFPKQRKPIFSTKIHVLIVVHYVRQLMKSHSQMFKYDLMISRSISL